MNENINSFFIRSLNYLTNNKIWLCLRFIIKYPSVLSDFCDPVTVACKTPLSMKFPQARILGMVHIQQVWFERNRDLWVPSERSDPDLKFPILIFGLLLIWILLPPIPLQQALLWGQWASRCSLSSRPLCQLYHSHRAPLIPANFSIGAALVGMVRGSQNKENSLSLASEDLSSSSDQHCLDV